MKNALFIPLIFLLSCSASPPKRQVSIMFLKTKLKKELGPRDDGLFYVWTYQGSDDESHYFHRQLGAMLNRDEEDGFYLVSKNRFYLGKDEFKGPSEDSSKFLDVTINKNGDISISPWTH